MKNTNTLDTKNTNTHRNKGYFHMNGLGSMTEAIE